jgi:hypothetical protein
MSPARDAVRLVCAGLVDVPCLADLADGHVRPAACATRPRLRGNHGRSPSFIHRMRFPGCARNQRCCLPCAYLITPFEIRCTLSI